MANHKSVAMIDTLITLHKQGWSNRKISRELEVDRETVSEQVRPPIQGGERAKPASFAHRA